MFCAALRRDVLEAVGPLDERFEVGLFEDDDYSARVKEAGYRVALAEDAFVHHFGEASFGELYANGRRGELFEANRRRFEAKWGVSWSSHERRPAEHYRALVESVCAVVADRLPPDATVLVVSNGDEALLELEDRAGRHFPQIADGTYAGHHPADGREAVAHLESLRLAGAQYLVFPETTRWWLEYYTELRAHLDLHDTDPTLVPDVCAIYRLAGAATPSPILAAAPALAPKDEHAI